MVFSDLTWPEVLLHAHERVIESMGVMSLEVFFNWKLNDLRSWCCTGWKMAKSASFGGWSWWICWMEFWGKFRIDELLVAHMMQFPGSNELGGPRSGKIGIATTGHLGRVQCSCHRLKPLQMDPSGCYKAFNADPWWCKIKVVKKTVRDFLFATPRHTVLWNGWPWLCCRVPSIWGPF